MEERTDDELLVASVISNKMDVILGRIREYSHAPTSEQYLQLASKSKSSWENDSMSNISQVPLDQYL